VSRCLYRPQVAPTHLPYKAAWTAKEFVPATADTFKFEADGKTTTVTAYFKAKYGVALKYGWLPLVRVNKTSLVPMEVLR
jgi:hypothetical protein